MDVKGRGFGVESSGSGRALWRVILNMKMKLRVPWKMRSFLSSWATISSSS